MAFPQAPMAIKPFIYFKQQAKVNVKAYLY
jgi:hypothetical protein